MGTCCAFNLNRPREVDFVEGKEFNRSHSMYLKSSGPAVGLTVQLDPLLDIEEYLLQSNSGFRVFVTENHNYPSEDMQPIMVEPNTEMFLSLWPKVISGDRTMWDLDANDRGCYFFTEPHLIYSK